MYFPQDFPKNGNAEKTALRVRRMNSLLDNIVDPNPNIEEFIFKTEREILNHEKPNNWNVHVENNMERTLEVDFHEYALAVISETGQDLKSTSAFVFYATVGMLRKKHKPNNK